MLDVKIGAEVENGAPVYLQLDELSGVHTGIVGTTGSGKTTLLTTIVAGLIAGRPFMERPNIWYCAYKGSGVKRLLAKTGDSSRFTVVDAADLSRKLMDEIERRREYGSSNESGMRPLVVAVDELGGVIGQYPELREALIAVVRTGRALRIHLCWAAQRVVGAPVEVLANTGTAIALRGNSFGSTDAFVFVGSPLPVDFKTGEALLKSPTQTVRLMVTPVSTKTA